MTGSIPLIKWPIRGGSASLRKQPTFGDATTGFPAKWRLKNERRNSILMTRHFPELGSASDWSCRVGNLIQPIRSTTQIWRVTRHQYGISALVSQTSFGGETCGSVAKCRLFSQAIEFRANSNRFTFPFRVRVTEVLLYVASHLNWIPKIMVQFCYLRLYLGIENVSCRLLLWMERMNTDWNSCKNYQNIVMDSAHLRNLFGIFFITLQQHFVYG